jgi:hypothetical protein
MNGVFIMPGADAAGVMEAARLSGDGAEPADVPTAGASVVPQPIIASKQPATMDDTSTRRGFAEQFGESVVPVM